MIDWIRISILLFALPIIVSWLALKLATYLLTSFALLGMLQFSDRFGWEGASIKIVNWGEAVQMWAMDDD